VRRLCAETARMWRSMWTCLFVKVTERQTGRERKRTQIGVGYSSRYRFCSILWVFSSQFGIRWQAHRYEASALRGMPIYSPAFVGTHSPYNYAVQLLIKLILLCFYLLSFLGVQGACDLLALYVILSAHLVCLRWSTTFRPMFYAFFIAVGC